MKILFAASEVTPIIKTGGLADVAGALPLALAEAGYDVRIVMPAYPSLELAEYQAKPVAAVNFVVGQRSVSGQIYQGRLAELVVYFVAFEPGLKSLDLYPGHGEVDRDRFVLFGLCVIEWLKNSDWQPNIVHGHDWMMGSLMTEIKQRRLPYGTVLTVHNGMYQGKVEQQYLDDLELDYAIDADGQVNQLRLGLIDADRLTTVSTRYAKELQQQGLGYGLEDVYQQRLADLRGIVNGIDQSRFGPTYSPYIKPAYNGRTAVRAKEQHKHALQVELSLPAKHDRPLYGMVSRAAEEKGFALIAEVIESSPFLDQAQLVILASNDEPAVGEALLRLAKKHKQNLRVIIGFDEAMAHRIFAASDFFIIPSRREPCGLTQMVAMRFGTVPIVHKTGGLADTVIDVRNGEEGTGIVFSDYAGQGLSNALGRSMGLYHDKHAMPNLVHRLMKQDWSWDKPVKEYEAVYGDLVNSEL